MADVTRGTNFFIVPQVDNQSMNQAEAKIAGLLKKAAAAADAGNDKILGNLNAKVAKATGQTNPEVKVKVSYETNSATGGIKEVRRLSASALDPMLADYRKMVQIQGDSALKVKQEIAIQKDKLSSLKQQALTLKTQSKRYKENKDAQKLVTDETKRLETVLKRVSTLASLKGQLRAESQKLSMMSQYNMALNDQGRMVATVNQEWMNQRDLVQRTTQQVNSAGSAAKGFGAKVASAGQAMQSAFGWIAAVAAGLAALGGAVGAITGRVKDIQAIKLTFDGLGQSVAAQNDILASAKNIALSYGVSLRKVEGAFRRLGPAILESGGSLKDTEGAIKSIAARTTMLGLNTEQTGRYIEAFAQVMGKGKLQSEELNQQFSELDGGLRGQLKNWLAANKGITDFEGAMKNGEITAGVFLEAFEAINEEVRQKFLRSIGDTQTAIESLGQKGGLTLNQLNAQMQTLTSIGMEGLAKAFAPIGKELMKVYAAFIQIFTKIATEMPGVTALLQGIGHIIGVVIKVALNTVLLGFGMLVKAIDLAVQAVVKLYEWMKKIPGLGNVLKGLEAAGAALNTNFDKSIDVFSKLSDDTIGAKTALEDYNSEMQNLERMMENREISEEEYNRKHAALLATRQLAEQNAARASLETEQAKLDEMLEKRKAQIARQEELMQREIEEIERIRDQEIAKIDEVIKALEKKAKASNDYFDNAIEGVKREAEAQKRANEDAEVLLRNRKVAVKRHYDERIEMVKDHYSEARAEMKVTHDAEMSLLDERIRKLKVAHQSRMDSLKSGPYQRQLALAEENDLKKKIADETDRREKLEMQAELEKLQNKRLAAAEEIRHAKAMAAAQAAKEKKEKEQAEEKKKLDAEEKERLEEIRKKNEEVMKSIADALKSIAEAKRQDARAEKDEIQTLKDKKKEASESFKKQINDEKEARGRADKAASDAIDARKEQLATEKRKIKDIEFAINNLGTAQAVFGDAVDSVTDGALQRQLEKAQAIGAQIARNAQNDSSGGSPTPTNLTNDGVRWSGGPVRGGGTYTVNELGKEGFLSASGKMSEIKAPSFGQWKAPGSGSVIPAHIWKSIKANQQTGITMPKMVNPGNATARAISTVSNTAGSQYNNSVTIQSTNPVQDANRMMVEMTRLKRRRLG